VIDIEKMYFHGVSMMDFEFGEGLSNIDLMESVLRDGVILTRNSLRERHPEYYRRLYIDSLNGEDKVSIACHFNKEYDYIKNCDKFLTDNMERAFGNYIEGFNSIILTSKVLEDLKYEKNGIVGEFQIKGNISLDYMVGVGISDYFGNICDRIEEILKDDNYLKYKYNEIVWQFRFSRDINKFLDYGYSNNGYYNYLKVQYLLEKYGYNVPIVDPFTGKEWVSREENFRRIEKIRNKALHKKLIRV